MSHAATKWAFDQPEIYKDMKPGEWSVLLVLADCHNPVNGCFPSHDYICRRTNQSDRTVRDQLARLRKRKLIDWDQGREDGRRGANRYRLGFEDDFLPAESAGSSTGEKPHSLPADSDTHYRQNLPTNHVIEPVIEPTEREARERDDENDLKKSFNRTFKHHPSFKGSEKEPAFKLWCELTDDERAEAEARMPALAALWAGQRRKHPPMPVKTIRDRIWQDVDGEVAQAQAAPCIAKPFGKLFAVIRMADLLAGPGPLPKMPPILQRMVDAGGLTAERERLAHHARHGFAKVNRMHEAAQRGTGWHLEDDDHRFADACDLAESIEVGSDVWNAWQAEHERRGWPWVPDLGNRQWFYFPAGGPDGLNAFEQQLRQLETSDETRHA